MKLIHRNDRYECVTEYHERHLPKSAGFRWDPKAKRWYTVKRAIAGKLADFAEGKLRKDLEGAQAEYLQQLEMSRATDSELDLPRPKGLEYLGFQKAGIAFALDRPCTLIGDEMGLGKTIQALGIVNTDSSIKKVLVICPASLRLNWAKEARKWLTREFQIGIVKRSKYPVLDGRKAQMIIINYDVAKQHAKPLRMHEWDLVIVDECHYLKNPKALRTKYILGAWHKDPAKSIDAIAAKRKVFLSGTPMLNRPIELWPLLKALDGSTWRHWQYYVERYCAGYRGAYGWNVKGASNLGELQEKLRSSIMVRRLKKDVLKELPPKSRQVIELPVNGAKDEVRSELSAYDSYQDDLDALRAAVELAKASDDPAEYSFSMKKLQDKVKAMFSEISRMRHDTAIAKLPLCVAHVNDVLAGDENIKLVVFAHHKDVVAGLVEGVAEAHPDVDVVTITGDTPLDARQAAVETFQTKGNSTRLIIGTLGAMGVGHTLTESSTVIFCELDWTPSNLSQAEDRCHRIGQKDNVLVQHLVFEDSLDSRMAHMLVDKQRIIDKALDVELDIAFPQKTATATEGETPKTLKEAAHTLPPEMISQIHLGLQMLAGICDGARAQDDMGFNGVDTRVGKSLAQWHSLSPKQAALGRKILMKYHRQLPDDINEGIRAV